MAIGDFNHIKDVLTTLDGLRPSRFGYTEAAVNATGANELAALVGVYVTEDSTQINSIPTPDLIGVDPLIINIGLRSQAASATRHTMNHFFGRLGLNLLKVTEKTKLLVENHLVNRYITPSGYVLEDIALGYTETTVTVTQSKSPLAANEPTTAATVLSMTGAVYNGNAGVMTGADKKKLDDAAASLNIAGLTTGKLLRYNSATGKIESATVAESGGALSSITSISMSGAITATTSGTINGLSISSGALSGISTLSMGGALSGVTTLGMSGQLTNTVTGVAPFVVSSAIQVANLNASLLQGYGISTSGANIPLLNGTNTWSAQQTISANLIVDTNTLYVDSVKHRVGIGITSPKYPLMVSIGNGGQGFPLIGNETFTISQRYSSGSMVLGYGVKTGNSVSYADTLFKSAYSSLLARAAIDIGYNGSIRFYTSGLQTITEDSDITLSQRMIILDTGNVGIGTTDPGVYKLYVAGDTFVSGTIDSYGVRGISTNSIGIFGSSGADHGVQGTSYTATKAGVYGNTTKTNAYAVSGNIAYGTPYSSQYLKYGEEISIIDTIKRKPFTVKKYIWEDSNYEGFFEFIGPYKEDIYNTFKLTHNIGGLFTVDGIALGLGIELITETDNLKLDVINLKSEIELLKEEIKQLKEAK